MDFLYQTFDNPFARKEINRLELPSYVLDNLKPDFYIRPYQTEAFKRFAYFYNEDFEGKQRFPYHLLYNMATGSGKTLIMAGLILYLYEKGYRNFLFFVNSNNIIKKTKDNFLNPQSSKYLFANKIIVDGKEVKIKEIENFDEADSHNINIKFVSIQMLTSGLLTNVKENGLSFEDFDNRKLVLIGDEAHHNNAEVWGDLVEKIHKINYENILLEFTATLDYKASNAKEKYLDKVIFKYDLSEFRKDKYSKEISLIRSHYGEKERIIQSLILNVYRQEIASNNGINLKPVILFKAKRTIKESEENKEKFHKLITSLNKKDIEEINYNSTVGIIQKAFKFFDISNINLEEITKRIKEYFREENCLSANESDSKDKKSKAEGERSDELLNTLEDINNPIRAVFAVQKLNEGWDVLNLFDIVRLYEGQATGGSSKSIGATTIAEAQLIGRGARYFPFATELGQDKYTRKFDGDINDDLKVLEELYYHTKEENRYISELKKALVNTGIYEDEDNLITKQLTLKPEFKKTEFYKTGKVVFNKKVAKSYNNVKSFEDLGVAKRNHIYVLSSGAGKVSGVFNEENGTEEPELEKSISRDIKISDIPKHVLRYGLTRNPYFYFNNLERFFPNVGSLSKFIESPDYLGGLSITFKGSEKRFKNIDNHDYLMAIQGLLQSIEADIKANSTEFEGSNYIHNYVHEVFKDKEIRIAKDSERADGQESLVTSEPWYAYNANYGTSEEKKFVELFARRFEGLNEKFNNIYLLRNERELKIYDKNGRAFEPDFVLFCKQKKGKELTFQVFIEPKGAHLMANDKWKEEFLNKMREEEKTIKIDTDNYIITGVPFYNYENENEFTEKLENALNE